MTMRYRRIYNEYELALLQKKLIIVVEDSVIEYVAQFDMDDIMRGDATKLTALVYDLLITELENSLELAQVGGLMPFEALTLATEGIKELFCALQYEETFAKLGKDK